MTEQTNAATNDEANEEIPVRHGTQNSMEKMLMRLATGSFSMRQSGRNLLASHLVLPLQRRIIPGMFLLL